MGISNKIAQYKAWKRGVKHCTFNPKGPGVVRMHLIPPRFRWFGDPEHIVILNGYYILPLGPAWALLLSAFMDEVGHFAGRPIGDADWEKIVRGTVHRVKLAYPAAGVEQLEADLAEMTEILFAIARGEETDAVIERMSLRAYAKHMSAPHRMDLMVSAMTDATGRWQCNQKCIFCYAAGQRLGKGQELSTEEWKRGIDILQKAGVPMLTFTGGEPTLRPDLAELIAHAKWFVTRLNTNGVALTPELVTALVQAELDSVQITLYSRDEEIHNRLVGAAHHGDTVRGISAALAGGLDVSVNTPLCRLNRDYVQTLAFLHELGVRYVTVSGLICTGTAFANHGEFDLSAEELADILGEAKAYCDTHEMEMDFTSPGLVPRASLEALGLHVPDCGAALSNMAVAPDGTVVPCQSWLGAEGALGNLLTDDFKSIWQHPKCRALRAMSEEEGTQCPFRATRKGEPV